MFLDLAHTKIPIYIETRKLVIECYKAIKNFPSEEKYALVQQIKRAVISVHLNVAEGASKSSAAERKRYYEIARRLLVVVDAAYDVAEDQSYCKKENLQSLGESIKICFHQLSLIINSLK